MHALRLGSPARPRWYIHSIPYLQSLAQPGGALLRAPHRESDHFVTHHKSHCEPFAWTATADSVLQKLERLTLRLSGMGH
jgi:putative transposase